MKIKDIIAKLTETVKEQYGILSARELADYVYGLYDDYDHQVVNEAVMTAVPNYVKYFTGVMKQTMVEKGLKPFKYQVYSFPLKKDVDQYYFFTCHKSKKKTAYRHVLYQQGTFYIMWVDEHDFLKRELTLVDIIELKSLLNIVLIKDGGCIENGKYRYYIDLALATSVFMDDVIDYGVNRTKMRNALDHRRFQYYFVINGNKY